MSNLNNKLVPRNVLYNLGAFDSEDGKTRQTGVIDLGDIDYEYNATLAARGVFPFTLSNWEYNSIDDKPECGGYNVVVQSTWDDVDGAIIFIVGQGTMRICDTSCTTVAQLKAKVKGIMLQFKLATSYTDTPIENQSILPLDTNMANKIRQKVVDGLNLWSYGGTIAVTGGGTYSGVIREVNVTPNTTYTFKCNATTSGSSISTVLIFDSALQTQLASASGGTPTITLNVGNRNEIKIILYASLQTSTYDTTTYSNIMLNSGNHPYPYSDFNQKEHITNEQAELLKSEYEKCSNLIALKQQSISPHGNEATISSYSDNTMVLNITTGNSNSSGAYIIVPLESGKTYTISCKVSATSTIATAYLGLDAQKQATTLNATSGYAHASFTTTSSNSVLVFYFSTSQGNVVTISDIMLTETSYPVPYHEYCGEILHEMYAGGTLLWKNTNPYTQYGSGDIELTDLSKGTFADYKFIVIAYRLGGTGNAIMYMKTSFKANELINVIAVDGGSQICYRSFTFVTATKITVGEGYAGATANNMRCIPAAIYGTNIL